MSTNERCCLECNDVLRGRADQKFCSDACRNTFNNRINNDSNSIIRNINNTLRKNRRILLNLLEQKKSKVKRETLMNKGYNFTYSTHSYTTKKGNHYFFCYDYGYLILEEELFFIVKDLNEK